MPFGAHGVLVCSIESPDEQLVLVNRAHSDPKPMVHDANDDSGGSATFNSIGGLRVGTRILQPPHTLLACLGIDPKSGGQPICVVEVGHQLCKVDYLVIGQCNLAE